MAEIDTPARSRPAEVVGSVEAAGSTARKGASAVPEASLAGRMNC